MNKVGKFVILMTFHQPVFLILFIGILLFGGNLARSGTQKNDFELRQLIQADFPRWDSDHDGKLSAKEINALIENPQVTGDEAAAVVVIRSRFSKDEDENESGGLIREQLLALANDPSVEQNFFWDKEAIRTCDHSLFLSGDPNLLTFQQGQVGDCYLLAVIGAFVNRDPQAVRRMIKPLPGNLFEVDFANGTDVTVPAATDAELLQGAKLGRNHGVWLSILEKAFASIRETNRKKPGDASVTSAVEVPRDFLGGGRTGPTIQRFTGHKTASAQLVRSAKNDEQATIQRINALLIQLTRDRRLITVGTLGKKTKLPPGVAHGHDYAVLGYNPNLRMVRVFNPWGNEFMPTGAPGLSNGYVVHHGIFNVPLQEFVQIFKRMAYETDQPLDN
jgi:Calpain family cysteine protease